MKWTIPNPPHLKRPLWKTSRKILVLKIKCWKVKLIYFFIFSLPKYELVLWNHSYSLILKDIFLTALDKIQHNCSVTSRQSNTQIQDILSKCVNVSSMKMFQNHLKLFSTQAATGNSFLSACISFNVNLKFSFLPSFYDFLLIFILLHSPQLLCLYFLLWNTNSDGKFYFL